MKRKMLPMAAACAATALAMTVGFSGSASAANVANAQYLCTYGDAANVFRVSAAKFSVVTDRLNVEMADVGPGLAINWDVLSTTVRFNGPSGAVQYSGTINDPYEPADGLPMFFGPLPKTSGVVNKGEPLSVIKLTGPPSATNWSIKIEYPGLPQILNTYCVGLTDFDQTLQHN